MFSSTITAIAYILAYDKYPIEKRTHFMHKKYHAAHELVKTVSNIEYDKDLPPSPSL